MVGTVRPVAALKNVFEIIPKGSQLDIRLSVEIWHLILLDKLVVQVHLLSRKKCCHLLHCPLSDSPLQLLIVLVEREILSDVSPYCLLITIGDKTDVWSTWLLFPFLSTHRYLVSH